MPKDAQWDRPEPTDHLDVLKKIRELERKIGVQRPLPQASPELGPPGDSSGLHGSADMGGYTIAKGKRKRRGGGGNYA